jgi:hypothetical protein
VKKKASIKFYVRITTAAVGTGEPPARRAHSLNSLSARSTTENKSTRWPNGVSRKIASVRGASNGSCYPLPFWTVTLPRSCECVCDLMQDDIQNACLIVQRD